MKRRQKKMKNDDTAAVNQDNDEQPEDNDDANSKRSTFVLYSEILFLQRRKGLKHFMDGLQSEN